MNLFINLAQKVIALASCTLFCCTTANSQVTATQLEEKFVRYNENTLQEKLYLHMDRNFYLAGDILWFKLYLVDAVFHQPLDVSKVAYVEVLDERNKPALQAKIGLKNGKGYGSFAMPVTIQSGNYKIRAYTSWMKNTGADYFFEKPITIVNTQKSRDLASTPANRTEPDIQLFPEGGYLVTDMRSKVGCKMVGPDGKGIDYTASVIDENNTTVTRFQSLKFGMGHFVFTPQKGHTYQVVIQSGANKYTRTLPTVFEKGYVMRLEGGGNEPLSIQVQTNTGDGKVLLVAQTRQSLKTVLQADLRQGEATFSIDPAKLGEGITQFTLFNTEGRPLCERLYFTFPRRDLSMEVSGGQTYETRSKIDLTVRAGGSLDTSTDMSVAVYRLDELQGIDENNIQTFLWLRSDLKGYIESPAYYFNKANSDAAAAIDNLMLTQGWRRFEWENVIKERYGDNKFPVEHSGHIVSGKITGSTTGKPLENIETYISVPSRNGNTKVAVSDAAGEIKVDFKNFTGATEMIIQTDPQADSTARVEINNPFSDQYTTQKLPPFHLSVKHEKLLSDRTMDVRVQRVYAGSALKQFENPYDTISEFQKPEGYYMIDDYTRFTTMEEIMREYVGSIDVRGDASTKFAVRLIENTSMPLSDMMHVSYFPTQPLTLVDGVVVFNSDKLMRFDPLKMRKLEVYNKRFVMGRSSFPGIMSWSTYKGNLTDIELDPRATVIDYESLQLKREFYSPVYDTPAAALNVPDYRTLLYWGYDIPADANGERHVRFYSSDKKGKYVAIVEGLNAQGQCGTGMFLFEVK